MKSKDVMNEISSNGQEEDEDEDDEVQENTTTSSKCLGLIKYSEALRNNHKNSSNRLNYKQQFAKNISISVLNSNFQSMSVGLHYGNFCLLCHVIFVRLSHKFIQSLQKLGKGSFGCVYEVKMNGSDYVIKVVQLEGRKSIEVSKQLYKEYFLACLADQLGAGPKMTPIFGYDLLVTETQVIFSMQKCFPSNLEKNESAYNQLSESLTLMHSVGFIHSDIKPGNIAFSEKCEKHIFLDFGISSLRSQRIGERSLVNFMGTLKYCSQQMKKCYILRKKMYVDLYENDWFSLKKTISEPKTKKQILIESSIRQFKKVVSNEKLINKFCAILNLKNQIFQVNIPNIIKYLEMCMDIPISCCEILQGKNVNKDILKDSLIMNFLKLSKQRMYKNVEILNEIDQQIYLCFNQQNVENILLQYFPIKAIIKMENRKFIQFIGIQYWLIKIFVFFDPFEAQKVKQIGCDKWVDRKNLVEKIFYTFASKEQIQLSDKFPGLISIKTEFTLHFFYKRVKKMKNLKLLHSLRLLFIATMSRLDYELIKEIEGQILILTEDRDELILRMINFHIFWRKHNCGFDFEYKQFDVWYDKVKSEQGLVENVFTKKLVSLLQLIYTCQQVNDLPMETKIIIQEIMYENQMQKFKYLIQNIRYFIYLMIFNKLDHSKDSLQWKILVFHQNNNIFAYFNSSNFERQFLKIFGRLSNELFKQIYTYFAEITNS